MDAERNSVDVAHRIPMLRRSSSSGTTTLPDSNSLAILSMGQVGNRYQVKVCMNFVVAATIRREWYSAHNIKFSASNRFGYNS